MLVTELRALNRDNTECGGITAHEEKIYRLAPCAFEAFSVLTDFIEQFVSKNEFHLFSTGTQEPVSKTNVPCISGTAPHLAVGGWPGGRGHFSRHTDST